jgi:hypothetical protein
MMMFAEKTRETSAEAALSETLALPLLSEALLDGYLLPSATGVDESGLPQSLSRNEDTQDNTPMDTESPVPPVPPLKDAQYLESRKSDASAQASFIAQEPASRKVSHRQKVPCPEMPCDKLFSNPSELARHICADHHKDSTFHCKHTACPGPQPTTSRESTIKRHHTERHSACTGSTTCYEEKRTRQRRYWGCGLCLHVATDAVLYAKHYQQHFLDGFQQRDIDYSTIMRSLLQQKATRQVWEKLDVQDEDGLFMSWDPQSTSELREALEYGIFRSMSIDDPKLLDLLLSELVRAGQETTGSSDATMEDATPFSNLISQFPMPDSAWQQAGNMPAASLAAEILRPNA